MSNIKSVYIGLCNPKSPSNVGSVMRAAGCYGANSVRYTGERYDRAARYHTDTRNAVSEIPLINVDDILSDLRSEMKVVCVELVEGATPLPDFVHPEQAMYIFGQEDGSISQDIIDKADEVVYVPTIGCMNLAATVNVLLYDRLSKATADIDHEVRIKSSRDVNNSLRVKS
ncbi:MAG: RNA methyltransferase [Pseudomonadales bacterium]